MEGTAEWSATRFEPVGVVKHGRSIRLPSATLKGSNMMYKISFDWSRFAEINLQLSKTEEIVIKEHFDIWLEGNPDDIECSSPEMQAKFDQFKSAWIMSQMFTNNY